MPDFMILIREDETEQQGMASSATKALVQGHARFVNQLKAAGAYRDSERLRPSAEGRRVRARGVEKGPFGDERAIAGYYLVKADDLDAAVALAEHCPMAPGDTLDVRPLVGSDIRADKTSHQGKTFAFGVLGNAVSEDAWVEVMDRIDADSRGMPRDERFVGGVRLEPPRRGRQIIARGANRMVLDGPFLESKEVIGGLFFMRISDLDEAVRWARASTSFLKHGALEIRELWRS